MASYLDPKNDLVFKRIFGSHPDLLISFLNALMPLEPGRVIESIEYVSNELVPDNPAKKFSVVDVRCRDNYKRHFIVEMQMEWSDFFPSRMLFNASKAYVQQLDSGKLYTSLQPVYALAILNKSFDHKTAEFYHRYQIANRENTDEVIEGLELIMVELPKFRTEKWSDRRMAVLWLRFLKEMDHGLEYVPEDFLADETIREAADICEKGGFTEAELAIYDKNWDTIRNELSVIAENLAKGREEGREEGRAEGARAKTVQFVLNCSRKGMSGEDIAEIAGLSVGEVAAILEETD
ncbi:MAG: Rpn family recombination-promoting nuclease/putative transposase [Dysgonamonadaceae bacterium]|jgi:predicted transposase/invertase (TIGR01784 family)|nr:Rpn family recombination-promoting nuclease/putative transposase [Dysgonamonadaceae bacterium]